MKSKKVLIGLILAAFVGTAGISVAQTKANYQNDLIEIGPDNFAGRVRAILADRSDSTNQTLYAGGVAGGLYKWGPEATAWEFIPCMLDGKQVTLPISAMLQTSHDNMIYIATGEGMEKSEHSNPAYLVPEGRGLFQFNPADGSFSPVQGTASMKYTNSMASLYRDGKLSLYVGTNDGLFLLTNSGSGFGAPQKVFDGPVQDIELVSADNMAFFTSGSHLWKISNVAAGSTPVDITTTNVAFGGEALRIELTSTHVGGKTYLYAVVANKNGLLEGVYLTTNQTQWTKLTTSTITPFTTTVNGWRANSITIDPTDAKRIFVGGATLWVGRGYVEGSNYQWTVTSTAGDQNNNGDFMEYIYPHSQYVHSGIHQILPVKQNGQWNIYLATDGGVFRTDTEFARFYNMNQGLGTVQFNSLTIAPDGSILGGAVANACPFIQSRNGRDGSNVNSSASILWFGDGGQVEATMFQQITPQNRRGFFFSCYGADFLHVTNTGTSPVANYGRSYADYFNYYNTQTWTIGTGFMGNNLAQTNAIANMALFETTHNLADDSITFTIDTLGEFIHNGQLVSFQDYQAIGGFACNYTFQNGDSLIVPSKPHFNYPFTVPAKNFGKVGDGLNHRVHNPIANRMYVSGTNTQGKGVIKMTNTPTDYSRVYTPEDATHTDIIMNWFTVYECSRPHPTLPFETVGLMAPTSDGDALYFQVTDTSKVHNYILGVYNLNACRMNNYTHTGSDLDYFGLNHITLVDTVFIADGQRIVNRPFTSLNIFRYNNEDILVATCGGETTNEPNLYVIRHINDPATRTVTAKTVKGGIALYSALVEMTTGEVIVGSANGVFKNSGKVTSLTDTWNEYGDFDGVPVTAIRQQTRALSTQRFIGHSGINEERYLFARTKYPGAIYFATYGRGIFMDMSYVTDTNSNIADDDEYNWASIRNVDNGLSSISVYPNPATDYATVDMLIATEGNANIRVYDLAGRCVVSENLGRMSEGSYSYRLDTRNLRRGMYLINVNIAGQTATKKLVVK